MTEETAKNSIDKINDFCVQKDIKVFEIIFYGGEPLINFDIIKYCINYCKCKETKFIFTMITNGTLLTEEIINLFKNNNGLIAMSIDRPKKINDRNRIFSVGNKSVYESIIAKIKLLKQSGVRYNLSITLNDYLLNHKYKILKWIKHLDVTDVAFNLQHLTDKNVNWEKFYKKSSKFIFKLGPKLEKLKISEDRAYRGWLSYLEDGFVFKDCGVNGCNQLTIKPSGDVTICHAYIKTKNNLGNINKDSILKILENTETEKWLQRCPLLENKCLKCPNIYVCGGGCANQSEHLFGGINKIDKAFCIYADYNTNFVLKRLYNMLKRRKYV